MPSQKVIDRAVAGGVPDGSFIGTLEILDVQHLSGPSRLGEARQQGLLLGYRMFSRWRPPIGLGLSALTPATQEPRALLGRRRRVLSISLNLILNHPCKLIRAMATR
jgi:hypothetical protein